jgi:hypothetical protein
MDHNSPNVAACIEISSPDPKDHVAKPAGRMRDAYFPSDVYFSWTYFPHKQHILCSSASLGLRSFCAEKYDTPVRIKIYISCLDKR